MKYKIFILLIIIISLVSYLYKNKFGDAPVQNRHTPTITENKWQKIASKRIYFGHQSVGFDIISGIHDLMDTRNSFKLNIIEIKSIPNGTNYFAHSILGKNMEPLTKVKEFDSIIRDANNHAPDIAFFKFCYIDFSTNTNINDVFKNYTESVSRLSKDFPNTKFIHVTVPLTTTQTGIKVWLKKLINKPIGGYDDNIARNEYNELLKNHFAGKEPVFDLASIESTHQTGSRSAFKSNGRTYWRLCPEYSYDGRHLNKNGRDIVAAELLNYIANLVD